MQAFAAAERFVDVVGTRVRYIEAGSGSPLLLVHGLGHSSTSWRRVIPGLSASHRVIALDLPGFGGSDAPADEAYDPDYFARVVEAAVEALSLGRVDAVGHSAGGLTLLIDALRAPSRYRKLVLVDPAGFTPAPDNLLGTAAASLARLLVSIPRNRALTRALYSTAFFDSRCVDEETVDELVKRGSNAAQKVAVRRAFAKYFDFCRRLELFHGRVASLETPMFVIWGSDDRLFRTSDSAVAKRVLHDVRIELFERCGHCPQIENPEKFVAAVLEFLALP
jgi:pimeloyl-ACP methyl ester carboxylesterase